MAIEIDDKGGPPSTRSGKRTPEASALPRSEMPPVRRAFPNGTPLMQRIEAYRRAKQAELDAKQAAAAKASTEPEDVA